MVCPSEDGHVTYPTTNQARPRHTTTSLTWPMTLPLSHAAHLQCGCTVKRLHGSSCFLVQSYHRDSYFVLAALSLDKIHPSISRCVYSLRPAASRPGTLRDRRYGTSTHVEMQQQRWLGSECESAGEMLKERTTARPGRTIYPMGRTVIAAEGTAPAAVSY